MQRLPARSPAGSPDSTADRLAARLRTLPTLGRGALWVCGEPLTLARAPVLTLVGSRAASRAAESLAERLGQAAAEAGALVVSGGAIGVDAAAHRGALRGGRELATLAVLGTGVDIAYPRRHAGLFREIAATGCLLSMFPPGTQAKSWHFPRRNHLMAALADAVVVIEAQADSGSLITALAAQRLGRRVLAFRGSPGTERLLSGGALLVRSIEDVLRALRSAADTPAGAVFIEDAAVGSDAALELTSLGLGPASAAAQVDEPAAAHQVDGPLDDLAAPGSPSSPGPFGPAGLTDLDEEVLALLAAAPAPLSVDALCASTGRNPADCAATLVGLELRGRCTRLAGGRFIVHAPLS
ncbi:MAG: DNA-processing protein DprA [Polyangia bacterium]